MGHPRPIVGIIYVTLPIIDLWLYRLSSVSGGPDRAYEYNATQLSVPWTFEGSGIGTVICTII